MRLDSSDGQHTYRGFRTAMFGMAAIAVVAPVTRSESSRGQTLGTIRTPTLREVSRGKVQR